jgi:cAMP-dependent protein kinase regulator
LDRDCFNAIVKDSSIKRRERFENFIGKVELLQELDSYDRNNFCDVLESETFEAGTYVFRQGEPGNKFYFIEEGMADALISKGGKEEIVFKFKANDYFGELALLNDAPRAASIKATSKLKLCSIERDAFKRLLGPLEDLLKKNSSKYEKYLKQGGGTGVGHQNQPLNQQIGQRQQQHQQTASVHNNPQQQRLAAAPAQLRPSNTATSDQDDDDF